MLASNIPAKWQFVFASGNSGLRTSPLPLTTGSGTGLASQSLGWQSINSIPLTANGIAPFIQDFNGAFNMCSGWDQWYSAGGQVGYDATFSTNIGGYMAGSLISVAGMLGASWLSGVDNNLTNPDTGGANWTMTKPASWGALYTSTGTANALAITLSPAPLAFGAITAAQSLAGSTIKIIPNATNTTAVTVAINGGTPIAVKRSDGAALQSGDIVSANLIEGVITTGGTTLQLITPVTSQIAVTAPLNYCVDTGAANAIVATPSPAITYTVGTVLTIKPVAANTGPVTANISAQGVVAVVRPDGSACVPNDISIARDFRVVIESIAGPTTILQMLSWPQNATGTTNSITGAAHAFVVADAGTTIVRSNSGAAMIDGLPGSVSSALPAGWAATVQNGDATALLSISVANSGPGPTLTGSGVIHNGTGNYYIMIGPGQSVRFTCDGTNYQCYGAPARAKLTANTTLFINASTGNDGTNGITSGNPMATLARAFTVVQNFIDCAGFQVTISAAGSGYTTSATALTGALVGQASPLIIQGAGSGTTTMSNIVVQRGANIQVNAMTITGPGTGTAAFFAQSDGIATVGTGILFGTSSACHLGCAFGGEMNLNNSYGYSGNVTGHWFIESGANMYVSGTMTITASGTPVFGTAFAIVNGGSKILFNNATVSFSGAVSGQQYNVSQNSVIASGATTFPGSGNTANTGGIYS